MIRKLLVVLGALACLAGGADARPRSVVAVANVTPAPPVTGLTVLNISNASSGYMYLNAMLSAHNMAWNGGATPAQSDDYDYPETSPGTLTGSRSWNVSIQNAYYNSAGTYHTGWLTGQGALTIPGAAANGVQSAGCTGMAISVNGSGVSIVGTPQQTTFTATGAGTNLTVSGVTGTIQAGDGIVATTGVPEGTIILSQTSGIAGGAGVYVTNQATTVAAGTLHSSQCDVAFNFTATNVTSPIQPTFPTGQVYHQMRGVYFVQDKSGSGLYNNYALYKAGGRTSLFDPDFLDFYATWSGSVKSPAKYANPCCLRFMDALNTNGSNIANYSHKPTFGVSFSYYDSAFDLYPKGLWGGAATGTGEKTNPWTLTYRDQPGGWTDGEMFNFSLPNSIVVHAITGLADNGAGGTTVTVASTSDMAVGDLVTIANNTGTPGLNAQYNTILGTNFSATTFDVGIPFVASSANGSVTVTPHVKVGARAAKVMIASSGGGFGTGNPVNQQLSAGSGVTGVYVASIDQVVAWRSSGSLTSADTGGGLNFGMPYEVPVALCNILHKHCYFTISTLLTSSGRTTEIRKLADYMATTLDPGLWGMWEYSNEVWNQNSTATQSGLIYYMANAIGYPNTTSNSFVESAANAYYAEQTLVISAQTKAAWQAAGRDLSTWNPIIAFQITPKSSTDSQRFQGQLNGTRYAITSMSLGGACTGGTFITVGATGSGSFSPGDLVGIAGQTAIVVGAPTTYPTIAWSSGTNPFLNGSNTHSGPGGGNNIYTVTTGGTDQFTFCMTPAVSTGTWVANTGAIWRQPLAPNRPIDGVKWLADAPYYQGAQICNTSDSCYNTATRVNAMKGSGQAFNQGYLFVNGTPTDKSNALDWIKQDLEEGTSPPQTVVMAADLKTWQMSTAFPDVGFSFNQAVRLISNGGTLPSGFAEHTAYFTTNPNGNYTATNASPAVFTASNHNFAVDTAVQLTSGAPAGFSNNTTYYVVSAGLTTSQFELAATKGGTPINSSSTGSGAYISNSFRLGSPTASTILTAGDQGSGAFSAGSLGFLGGGQQTILNLSQGTATGLSGGPGEYGPWAFLATAYGVGIINYEGASQQWTPSGSILASGGDTFNPPNSYGGDQAASVNTSTGRWTSTGASNLIVGNAVMLNCGTYPGNPVQFQNYKPYYVVFSDGNTQFDLSATQGGSVIVPNTSGATCKFSQDAGNLWALQQAYKTDTRFYTTTLNQLNQEVAAGPVGKVIPGWYTSIGAQTGPVGTGTPNVWALTLGDEIQTSYYYQSYYALCHFNGGGCWLVIPLGAFRRRRKAANDNDAKIAQAA